MPASVIQLGNQIEILNPDIVRGRIGHVLYDFDGTLSLVREGWQNVMVPMLVEVLAETGTHESTEELTRIVREWVARLTGKQTIHQMIELADQTEKRGGTPKNPLEYKHEFLARLEVRINRRVEGLADGTIDPERLLVPGARELLEAFRARGIRQYLASGTDEPFVLREAKLLGIDGFFDGGMYGALDNVSDFSKQMIIDRIMRENGLHGPELLGIGDGYVEIENIKGVGGIALGVPTFEPEPADYDPWKKERLIAAGADLLVPHFREHRTLVEYLFQK